MKKLLTFFFLIPLLLPLAQGQPIVDEDALVKIVIRDHQDYKEQGYYGSIYEIELADGKRQLVLTRQYYKLDTIFKGIDLQQTEERVVLGELKKRQITDLIKAVNDKSPQELNFERFDVDVSLGRQELELEFQGMEMELESEHVSICRDQLDSKANVQKALSSFYSQYWSFDYPLVSVLFISATDTVKIETEEQEPFMLPWKINGKNFFNPDISRAIATILPEYNYSNKTRLAGTYFLPDFLYHFYNTICAPAVEKVEWRRKYSDHFKALQAGGFEIIDYELITRADPDMDGTFMEYILQGNDLSENVQLKTKFYLNDSTLSSPALFLDQTNYHIKLLKESGWFYNRMASLDSTQIYLTFGNEASVNNRVFNFIYNDARKFVAVNKLEQKLRQGVMVEVHEPNRKMSRWILLPDNQVVLWHYRGNGALGFTDQQLGKQPSKRLPLKVVGAFVGEEGVK